MNDVTIAEQSGALVVVGALTPAAIFTEKGGVDAILDKIRAEVAKTPIDISTPAGREAIRSTAYRIQRSKSLLNQMGKSLGEESYKAWKKITAERARIETELDALRDEFRAPLTAFESAEKTRVEAHEAALKEIEDHVNFVPATSAIIAAQLNRVRLVHHNRDWQEFAARATAAREIVTATLTALLEETIAREAAEEEATRQRQEEAARQRQEREAAIAARAAEEAKREAERKAAQEAAAAAERARRQREAIEEKARQEAAAAAVAAHEAAENARLAREAVEARARKEAEAAEERARQAEITRKAEAETAERNRVVAAEKAERDRLQAIEDERARVAEIERQTQEQTAKREADRKHKARIHREARDAIADALAEASPDNQGIAEAIVSAIARGLVPHTRISY